MGDWEGEYTRAYEYFRWILGVEIVAHMGVLWGARIP